LTKKRLLAWTAILPLCLIGSPLLAQCTSHAALTNYDRQEFVAAAYGQDTEIAFEYLAAPGCYKEASASLAKLGAKIEYSDKKVGYALLILPKDKLFDSLDVSGIAYATVPRIYKEENFIPVPERKIVPIAALTIPTPRVAKSLPSDGPYFPADEIGLNALWKQHPEADGRGVRVAVADDGFDLLHPELLMGRDSQGALVPKVSDLDLVTSPETDDDWVQFGPLIKSKGGAIHTAGRAWKVPSDGEYRFGVYDHKMTLGYEDDPKEHPIPKVELSAGVLWSEERKLVWVDADGDGDFSDDPGLADYAVRHEIGWFGSQEGADDNRIPFGVKIDAGRKAAYISIGGDHGAYIAGPLAGNKLTGGLFDGTAPAAELIDVRFGDSQLPVLLRAFARPDSDIVNRSGGIARDLDSEVFERHVLERALAVYRKPFVCYCDLANAIHVDDYQSPEMLRRNRQLPPPYLEAMNSEVWFKEDGLVNTVLAPSASLVTESRYVPVDLPWADGKRHITQDILDPPAPDGYSIGANNSPTIVVVSGVLADLISEARRRHVRYGSVRLTNALLISAKQVSGFSAAEQGYGLVDAAGAWYQLEKMANADDPKNPTLTSFTIARDRDGKRVEVHGFHANLPTPGGDTIRGDLWLTRIGGYAGARAYRLDLQADDGTYTILDRDVSFARAVPRKIEFEAKVRSGLHVGFLQLINKEANVVMQEIPISVRAPEVAQVLAPGVERYEATIPPRHVNYRYFRIEEGVQAMRATVDIPWGGSDFISARGMEFGPGGEYLNFDPSDKMPDGSPIDSGHSFGPMEHFEALTADVRAGTGSVFWENRGRPEYETPYDPPAPDVPIKGTLRLSKYAVALTLVGQNLRLTNKLAEIQGRVEFYDGKLNSSEVEGSGARASATLDASIPSGLAQWRVNVSSESFGQIAYDAFLLNCTNEKRGCFGAAQQPIGKHGTTIVVDGPEKGDWRIVIRTREATNRAITYRVRETTLTSSTIPNQSLDGKYSSGETWSVPVPAKQSDAQYAAFRISGTEDVKDGLRIAITPLTKGAP
jgi:hypothetical protein